MCKQVMMRESFYTHADAVLYDALPPNNAHGCLYTNKDLTLLAALLQSAPLQNNGGMFRPVTILQYLSDEGDPEIIQPVLISSWDPISIFKPY